MVVSADGSVRKPGAENLAGSALTLDRAVIDLALHCGVSLAEGWARASTRPAALARLPVPPPVTVRVTAAGMVLADDGGARGWSDS